MDASPRKVQRLVAHSSRKFSLFHADRICNALCGMRSQEKLAKYHVEEYSGCLCGYVIVVPMFWWFLGHISLTRPRCFAPKPHSTLFLRQYSCDFVLLYWIRSSLRRIRKRIKRVLYWQQPFLWCRRHKLGCLVLPLRLLGYHCYNCSRHSCGAMPHDGILRV